MRLFRWFPAGSLPSAYDLRRLGWRLLSDASSGPGAPVAQVGSFAMLDADEWLRLAGAGAQARGRTLLVDVPEPRLRARLLKLGFGDALGFAPALEELEARAARLAEQADTLPRTRRHGAIAMDLQARDAVVAGRPVGLHPREFGLLWRLAECPGEPVSTAELLGDVWRLSFRPETNSLAVHLSRLRAKLRTAGVDGMIETLPGGHYRLSGPNGRPAPQFALDEIGAMREDPLAFLELQQDAAAWTLS